MNKLFGFSHELMTPLHPPCEYCPASRLLWTGFLSKIVTLQVTSVSPSINNILQLLYNVMDNIGNIPVDSC